jgi:hypothetical protein
MSPQWSPQPVRLGPEWSSPVVMAAIVLLLAAFVLYLFLLEG